MLLEYLQKNYKVNEPIFVSDIDLPVTDTNLRQMFKVLCDSGQIYRYETGIYYMKGNTRLKGGVPLSASKVARYKYITLFPDRVYKYIYEMRLYNVFA